MNDLTEIEILTTELKDHQDPAHEVILTMLKLFNAVKQINAKKCFDLGFTSAQNVVSWDAINKRSDCDTFVKYYMKVLDVYGKDAILVTQKEFVQIVEKYDLVCGQFCDYTGIVPDTQITKIEEAMSRLKKGHKMGINPYYLSCLCDINLKKFSEKEYYDILRFPFYKENFETIENEKRWEYIMNIVKERHKVSNIDTIWSIGFSGKITNLFIASPAKDMGMKSKMEKAKERSKAEAEKRAKKEEEIRQRDPLICTWIPNVGVIVHTAWGVEASDELIQKRTIVNEFITKIINDYIMIDKETSSKWKKFLNFIRWDDPPKQLN